MPLATKRNQPPDPSKVYVAWQGWASADPETGLLEFAVRRGQRLRGDHPAVAKGFANFVEDGTPPDQWPGVFDEAIRVAEERARKTPRPEPPGWARGEALAEVVKPLRAAIAIDYKQREVGLVELEKGQKVLASDPLVSRFPEHFGGRSEP